MSASGPVAYERSLRWIGLRLDRVLVSRVALAVVLTAGAAARALQYLADRSLSGDESFLALNLVTRSYGGLLDPLDFNQVAPQLLLLLEKASLDVLGTTDSAVRLVPFVAGLATLVIFPLAAARTISPWALLPAVAIVALSNPLVAWTATDKQYAVDALATATLVLAAVTLGRRVERPGAAVGLGAIGAVAVWLSFPSAFVLAGVGASLAVESVRRRHARALLTLCVICSLWLVSFAGSYASVQRGVQQLQRSFEGDSSSYIDSGSSLLDAPAGAFRYVSGVPRVLEHGSRDIAEIAVLALAVLALVGAVAILSRSPSTGMLLLIPPVAALVAAAAKAYPLVPRAAIWSIPILALLSAEGMATAMRSPRRRVSGVATVVASVVIAVVAAPTIGHLVRPRATQEMRPVLQVLAEKRRLDDRVFVYFKAQYGLRWYLECDCAGASVRQMRDSGFLPLRPAPGGQEQWAPTLLSVSPGFIVGTSDTSGDEQARELRSLAPHPRTWILMSNLSRDERRDLLAALDTRGRRLDAIEGDGDESAAGAYLYALRAR